MSRKPTLYCGFCGASQHERRKIVAKDPETTICEVCIGWCAILICDREMIAADIGWPEGDSE